MNYAYLDNIGFARKLGVYAPELLPPDVLSNLILEMLFA